MSDSRPGPDHLDEHARQPEDTAAEPEVLPRSELEQALQDALAKAQFELHLQPQINLSQWRLQGMEVYLRWRHPDHGLIPPSNFIPVLEETGMIVPVAHWLVQTACTQNRQWQDSGLRPLRLAVQISNSHLMQDNAIDSLLDVIQQAGHDPAGVELQFHETCLAEETNAKLALLKQFKDRGVRLALDYSGAGYSPAVDLTDLPIDTFKLDRQLVEHITRSRQNRSILSTLLSAARELGLEMVAEGVETAEQLVFLNAMHCTAAQGFLFSPPLTVEKFEALYRADTHYADLIQKIGQRWTMK